MSPKVAKASKEGRDIADVFAYKLCQCTQALSEHIILHSYNQSWKEEIWKGQQIQIFAEKKLKEIPILSYFLLLENSKTFSH